MPLERSPVSLEAGLVRRVRTVEAFVVSPALTSPASCSARSSSSSSLGSASGSEPSSWRRSSSSAGFRSQSPGGLDRLRLPTRSRPRRRSALSSAIGHAPLPRLCRFQLRSNSTSSPTCSSPGVTTSQRTHIGVSNSSLILRRTFGSTSSVSGSIVVMTQRTQRSTTSISTPTQAQPPADPLVLGQALDALDHDVRAQPAAVHAQRRDRPVRRDQDRAVVEVPAERRQLSARPRGVADQVERLAAVPGVAVDRRLAASRPARLKPEEALRRPAGHPRALVVDDLGRAVPAQAVGEDVHAARGARHGAT